MAADLIDAIGWTESDTGFLYGGVAISEDVEAPDAVTRLVGNDDLLSAAAWYYGELTPGDVTALEYDTVSENAPEGATLTAGEPNYEESAGAGGAGKEA